MALEIQSIFNKFKSEYFNKLLYRGFEFSIKPSSDSRNLIFSVPLYKSKDESMPLFLQKRMSLKVRFPEGTPETELYYDPLNRQIVMTFCEEIHQFNYPHFEELIEELSWLAKEWKKLLLSNHYEEYEFVYIHRN